MSKFSSIIKGTRAEKAYELPPLDGGDKGLACLLRPLNGLEEEETLVNARARAIEKGVKNPQVGEPIYDFALMIETLAFSCLDAESPPEARERYFADADEIRANYGREAIAYVYEAQQRFQDDISPGLSKLDAKGYIDAINTIGGPDEEAARRFLERCRPGLAASLLRTMGVQLRISLWGSSDSGSASTKNGETSNEKRPS